MAEDNELNPSVSNAAGTPAGGDAPVEELSWEHVETYRPVSTDASDSETVFATRTDEVEVAPAPAPAAAPVTAPAQATEPTAASPYPAVERQPVPTYMPAGATPPAGSAYAAAPGGPGAPTGNNPYAAPGGYGAPVAQPQPQRPSSGKAVGALVCGILAILFSETVIVGIVLGIVALVLAGQAVRAAGKDGKTTGAKVCGVIGIVLSVLSLVAYLILFAVGLAFLANYDYDYSFSHDSWSSTPPSFDGSSSDGSSNDDSSAFDGPLAITEDDQAALAAAVSALQNMGQDPELMAFIADEAANAFEIHTSGLTLEMVDIDPSMLAQWLADSVVVDESDAISLSDEDTHTATVFLDVECYDMDEYINAIIDLVEEAPEVPDDDGEAALQLLHDCATEALNSTDTYEYSIAIDLTKEGDAWVADQSSLREAATLMFCLYMN